MTMFLNHLYFLKLTLGDTSVGRVKCQLSVLFICSEESPRLKQNVSLKVQCRHFEVVGQTFRLERVTGLDHSHCIWRPRPISCLFILSGRLVLTSSPDNHDQPVTGCKDKVYNILCICLNTSVCVYLIVIL